ncbi:hypothetical protein FACS189418_9120 [Clostridia bacterium]|nr:hypothetical protein FACS189418_9120 [Clostridia bacterium]
MYADVDLERLVKDRQRMNTYGEIHPESHVWNYLTMDSTRMEIERFIDPTPFVPKDKQTKEKRCEEILSIQSYGLKKRLEHTQCINAIVGVSGGLDSTLALLVTVKAFDLLNLPRENILAVTMPGFGTSDWTYQNSCRLSVCLGVNLKKISIEESVRQHFKDIGQDENVHDITYENAQARERTQILMDLANKIGALVIGTGDMSELALGWATYNGDHMSMYAVNTGVPKTLVRHLVEHYQNTVKDERLSLILQDILNTPISPELLPLDNQGGITQKTEDTVGPYELHDFFLYYMLRYGFSPAKIDHLAELAFWRYYDRDILRKWMKVFYKRFFSQQFKRSCLPDGPKVGSIALSPRGDLRMPSDASSRLWLIEIEQL